MQAARQQLNAEANMEQRVDQDRNNISCIVFSFMEPCLCSSANVETKAKPSFTAGWLYEMIDKAV